MRKSLLVTVGLVLGIVIGLSGQHALNAQQEGVKATPLLKTDLSGIEGKEVVMVMLEMAPGSVIPRHFHQGQEFAYILDGTGSTDVEGQPLPDVKTGDAQHRPLRVSHDLKNTGTTPLKVITVFVADKGQPLVVPVK